MFTMTMPAPAREAIETLNQNGHARGQALSW